MRNLRLYKKILIVLFASVTISIGAIYLSVLFSIPDELILIQGEEYKYDFKSPFVINIKADREGIIKVNGGEIKSAGNDVHFERPVSFSTDKNGSVKLAMKLFGLLPVKTVRVDIVSSKEVVACGNTVGVKLNIDGILVIGISEVETANGQKVLPSKDTGVRPGYVITEVNNNFVDDVDDLIDEIDNSSGNPIKVRYRYGNTVGTALMKPVKAADDNRYHIGLWVRDSTAGIGTLTFYDPQTGSFGALGHGITDIDTGTLMPVESGEILESSILGVKIGKSGVPGELKGIFVEDTKLGEIFKNTETGIYGNLSDEAIGKIAGRAYPIGLRSEIREGPAVILSNIDGKNINQYDIEIQKVSKQNTNGSKGMIIKVTDPELLSTTGGIVQGMSGSPILQNGKIIGAVTHVLINDPTRGYGIFIEAMLKNITGNNTLK
ncbi:MAG: SpoIVB peptidase [Ruminiclostridium sp.]|nr:SpoIVB peptidase [Ruminiclostridium sp.]